MFDNVGIREDLLKHVTEYELSEQDYQDNITYGKINIDVTGSLGVWGINQE